MRELFHVYYKKNEGIITHSSQKMGGSALMSCHVFSRTLTAAERKLSYLETVNITENFVLQTLITQFEVTPRYWMQTNPPYEMDFLIQRENDILPVEVKSDANTTSRSLKKFKELFPDQVKLRIRFSLDNLKLDDAMLNIPLFMADQSNRLIGLALKQRILQ